MFKRDSKLYFVINGYQYRADISDVNLSQEVQEAPFTVKTIQNSGQFSKILVHSFGPAEFNFNLPALRENDFQVIFDRALDYKTFDIYVETSDHVFEVTNCIITNTSFLVDKFRPLRLNIAGQGSKLSKVGDAGVYTIPGTPVARSNSRTYNRITNVEANLGDVGALDSIRAITIELQTNIKWTPNNILNGVCTDSTTVVYPEEFTVEKRILSGSITSHKLAPMTISTSTSLYLLVGQKVGGITYGFEFDLNSVAYTSRTGVGELYTHSYDWRLTENPRSLSELITYITDPNTDTNAILDFWGDPILDSNNQPILDSF